MGQHELQQEQAPTIFQLRHSLINGVTVLVIQPLLRCVCMHCVEGEGSSFEGHVRAAKSSAAAVLNNQVCMGICSGQKCKVTQHVYILEFIITLIYLLYIWSRVLKDTKTHLFHVVARLIVRLISFETSVHYGDASISYRELLN